MHTLSMTPSGIPAIGDIPWGSHFCNFYATPEDLADSLVPFFKAGLENNEQCLWVTSEPFGAEDAKVALRNAVPDLAKYLEQGRIDILDYREWYLRTGRTDADGILQAWLEHKDQALARGRSGLRLTGNTFWIEAKDWKDFADYEERVNQTFHQHQIVALCSYCLHRCEPVGILDVVRNHQFAVARREGAWEVLESASLKMAKAELRQLNAELERRVAERTAALEAALQERLRAEQEALAAVRARDEFLSMASHELKTPLTSLKLQLGLVKSTVGGTEGELGQRLGGRLQTMERQLQRLNVLNSSLLDVTSLDSGRLHLDFQKTDLAVLVREALERLEPDFARAGCEVRLEVEGETQGWWDALRLDQVVVNLLSNALKYGAGKPVHVHVQKQDAWVRLRVKDQGIGIAPEAQRRLFRKFERAVPTQHYGGLGLGLYISRTLVEAMRGTIEVDSQVGQGATFTVLLPCEPELH
ncbi:MEDS domain-containing protein [Hyalangium sp. s54d21]|uniref:histidine kinase n=1 Tax=Hyalangium rubrum TaxID=3103134 RepID=A0ABU5HAE5_9BACT|nr:MEDS domain-containing protein [Hyalangium sp. s54d21]MDY7230276.1 MEDS domain-containing protein [Hyalangium sp. s54d21]